tara:strand:+ start:433 stop:555 length:123 start_codon:yes stop_codon:yes gene_type:complete
MLVVVEVVLDLTLQDQLVLVELVELAVVEQVEMLSCQHVM